MRIRRAHADEAAVLTDLCLRSKRSNGYDDAFMAACRKELTVTKEALDAGEFWVAVDDNIRDNNNDRVCGCTCLIVEPSAPGRDTLGEISAFFIDPDFQRQGIGRVLWQQLLKRAQDQRVDLLHLAADPFAVPFYQAMGFVVTGYTPSGSIAGRQLPQMTRKLP